MTVLFYSKQKNRKEDDSQQEKVQKLHENRLKAQTELNTLGSIGNVDRRVRAEHLIKETEDAMTKAFH